MYLKFFCWDSERASEYKSFVLLSWTSLKREQLIGRKNSEGKGVTLEQYLSKSSVDGFKSILWWPYVSCVASSYQCSSYFPRPSCLPNKSVCRRSLGDLNKAMWVVWSSASRPVLFLWKRLWLTYAQFKFWRLPAVAIAVKFTELENFSKEKSKIRTYKSTPRVNFRSAIDCTTVSKCLSKQTVSAKDGWKFFICSISSRKTVFTDPEGPSKYIKMWHDLVHIMLWD